MKLDELKPCPFCGGGDIRIDGHDMRESPTGKVFSMCCYHCGATFPNRYKRELLVASWNTRAALPADDALIEKLEAEAFNPTYDDRMGKWIPLSRAKEVIRQHQCIQTPPVCNDSGKDVNKPLIGWQPIETAPRNKSEVLLLTTSGVVSAWYAKPSKIETIDGTEYDGDLWICYDDKFQIENNGGDILGWMHLPPPLAATAGKGGDDL